MRVVKRAGSRPVEFGGEVHSGWLPPGAAEPLPTPLRVVELSFAILEDGAESYILEWTGPDPDECGDTWHPSVETALEQAELAFGVGRHEWHDEEAGRS